MSQRPTPPTTPLPTTPGLIVNAGPACCPIVAAVIGTSAYCVSCRCGYAQLAGTWEAAMELQQRPHRPGTPA